MISIDPKRSQLELSEWFGCYFRVGCGEFELQLVVDLIIYLMSRPTNSI